MAQEIKASPAPSDALAAVAKSLRQVATPPAPQTGKARRSPEPFAPDASHMAPPPRSLSHGMTAPTSPALTRAHNSAAWQPAATDAPSGFRDSPQGHAWQMTHFESVWQHLGPAPTPASISKARTYVAKLSRGVPADELDAFIYDMRVGAESHQAYLVRIINLSLPQGPMAQAHSGVGQALCSELERTLAGVHVAVRDLFVQDLRRRAHLNVLKFASRS